MINKLGIFGAGGILAAGLAELNSRKSEASGKNYFKSAYRNRPDPEKIERGGEDAWIISDDMVAVADGVGGWWKKGIDSGIFAR